MAGDDDWGADGADDWGADGADDWGVDDADDWEGLAGPSGGTDEMGTGKYVSRKQEEGHTDISDRNGTLHMDSVQVITIRIYYECEGRIIKIHHWCSVGTKNSQPEGPPFQWETRLAEFPLNGRPEGWDFSGTTEHQ